MAFRPQPIRIALVALATVAASCESTAEAQFGSYYNYYSGYGPTTSYYAPASYAPMTYSSYYAPTTTAYYGGYGNGPLGLGIGSRVAARRAYRWGGYGGYSGYSYGGYASNCCGTCGVTTNYAPSCGCASPCDCSSPCGCVGGCASGECGLNSSPNDTVVNSVPSDVEPTPVAPKNRKPAEPETFDNEPLDDDPGFRPSDGFRPNTNRNGTGTNARPDAGGLPDDFNSPLTPDPAINRGPIDSGTPNFEFNPNPADGPIDNFKVPSDDSAALPRGDASIASNLDTLPSVRLTRGRTQVRARFGIPALTARNQSIEVAQPFSAANLASAQ